jgi:exonuclease SbcC
MKLRSLALKNIRSYKDETVKFPQGLTVFAGDVGSGKSTILYAIEYALFGSTSDLPFEYLLRHGEDKGSVELVFEIDGKKYTVHREFERKNDKFSSTKKGNWIRFKDAMVYYTPQELKEQMLRTILQFNESLAPRASSVIYRFAVFTPQEEMKRILDQRIDDRLKTLRKAFRVEDYKVAQDNSKVIRDHLRRERAKFEGKASDLEEKEEQLEHKRKERTDQEERLRSLAKKMKKLEAGLKERKKAMADLERLQREKMNLEKYQESTLREVEHLKSNLNLARNELKGVDEKRAQMEKLEPKLKEYDDIKERIEAMDEKKALYDEKAKDVLALEKDMEALVARIKELEEIMTRAPELKSRAKDLEKKVNKADKAMSKVEENKGNIVKLEAQLESCKGDWGKKFAEHENYKDLEGKAKCPKCGQELTPQHLKKVMEDLKAEMKELEQSEKGYKKDIDKSNERIEKYTAEARGLEQDREEMHRIRGELERLETEGTRLKELKKESTRQEVDLKAAKGSLQKLAVDDVLYVNLKEKIKDLDKLARAYVLAREAVENADKWRNMAIEVEGQLAQKEEKLGKIGVELEKLMESYSDTTLDQAKEEYEAALEKVSGAQAEEEKRKALMERIDDEISHVKKEIDKKREAVDQADANKRAEDFLSDCFHEALDVIEKHVMASINEEFEVLFQKWFNMLIESPEINVRVDDNFTPIIEQEGYELDHGALSGGERTSVALAFRLALNAMVKKTSTVMKENLLILDEPTDGFSMEQLSKVRDVLEELRSDQCIIVTHERELESFADKVFRVDKVGGESRIIE